MLLILPLHHLMQCVRALQRRQVTLSEAEACRFYEEHKGKPFFDPLIQYMTSGDVLAFILSSELFVSPSKLNFALYNKKLSKWREIVLRVNVIVRHVRSIFQKENVLR